MPFDLSEVLQDPDLCQHVTIYRTTGEFYVDGWKPNTPTPIQSYGCITIASSKALEQVPEGDRVTGSIEFCTVMPIYATSEDMSLISDEVEWRDKLYRVQSVAKWVDFGYYSAILVRMQGS